MMMTFPLYVALATLVLTAGLLAFCALSDLRSYQIPNWACLAVASCWAIDALCRGELAAPALLTGAAVLALGALTFWRGWMGGGDVKLLAATALWSGPAGLAGFSVIMGATGALLALIMVSPANRLLPAPPAELTSGGEGPLSRPMPFGVAISVAGLWAIAQHWPVLASGGVQ